MFDELLNLLLPTSCAICGRSGAPVCPECQTNFESQPRTVIRGGLVGHAVGSYNVEASLLIRAFKERGQTAVAKFMAPQMAALIDVQAQHLLPVPSSRANQIKRGYSPALVLARQVSRVSKLPLINSLRLVRPIADQASLGFAARQSNLQFSMSAKPSLRGQRVLLVDDVVTTGATLIEAARAAHQQGAKVVGFLTFSETLLKIDHDFQKIATKN